MGVAYNSRITTDGLILALDAANNKSILSAVEVLVVAGGGAGGNGTGYGYESGGGGAGGLIYSSSHSITPGSAITATVGAGGASATSSTPAANGSNSVFGALTAIGGGGMIITKLTYYMELAGSGVIRLYFYDVSSPGYHNGNINIPLNTWSHVVGIRDFQNNSILIYVNGSLDRQISSITGNIRSSNTPVTLGSYSGGSYEYTGRISNAKIYNRALSAAEIQQNFIATRGRFGI